MDGTVRRDEGIDRVRFEEVTSELGDGLLPALRKLPGFSGCYVFESALSNRPKITAGAVIAHSQRPIRRTIQGGFHESAAAW